MAEKPETVHFDFDRLFQVKMLRTLFQDPDFTNAVGVHLAPQHFERRAHQWLAKAVLDYAKKHGHGIGNDALKIFLTRDLKSGVLNKAHKTEVETLIERIDRPVKDKSFIKEELYKFIKNQTVRDAIVHSLDHLDAHDFAAIDKEFIKVIEIQEAMTGGLGHFYVRDVKDRTTKRKRYEKNGVSTGTKLDDYMKPGGLPPKTLGCVVAPSGRGKSHCLVHIGKSAIIESNARVLHITLEMSEESILDRYDTAMTGIAINRIEDKADDVENAVSDLGSRYGECLVVKEFPPATLTVPMLRAYIRQLERVAFYPTLIIIDYADEMLPTVATRDHDTYEEMGCIYSELRKMAVEMIIPVWTASQTQRTALNKEIIDIDSIADSFKKIMKSDFVVCFCQTRAEKTNKVARFFVAKSRLGPDKFEIKIRPDWGRSIIKAV